MRRRMTLLLVMLFSCLSVALSASADDKLKKEELDQLLAPIALYPDDLLTNVLVASTYPLDVVQAARWVKEPAKTKLKGDALTKALEAKEWDPSVKSLVQFPDVLTTMSDKLEWTQKLGDAFLAQQNEVMDEIQFLRAKADEAGHLSSNKQQKVVKESGAGGSPVYIIEPATQQTVYAPVYDPTVVYGSWWYPAYPPYAWTYPGAAFVNGIFWSAGVAVAHDIWGWGHWDWHHHDIDIDVNKWNNINANRNRITNNKWEYRPDHRGPVPYRNKEVREKYNAGDHQIGNNDFRGHDRAEIKDRLNNTDHAKIDRDPGAGGRIPERAQDRGKTDTRNRAGDISPARDRVNKASRDANRPRQKASPGTFDIKKGSDVRRHAERGRSSRSAMASQVHRGGGGHHPGGGRHGGGRRR